jgi:hypothetical protein
MLGLTMFAFACLLKPIEERPLARSASTAVSPACLRGEFISGNPLPQDQGAKEVAILERPVRRFLVR